MRIPSILSKVRHNVYGYNNNRNQVANSNSIVTTADKQAACIPIIRIMWGFFIEEGKGSIALASIEEAQP